MSSWRSHLLNVADHEDVAVADTLDALRGVAPDEVARRAVNLSCIFWAG